MIIPGFIKKIFTRNLAIADSWIVKMGAPVYTTWTLQKAVAEGYKVNGWVYRSVYLIAKAGSQVGWVVTNDDTGEQKPDHHLSKLFRKPNPHISRQDMFELIISWLELVGNSYLKKVKAANKTVELWPVSPDRLSPVPAKQIDEWLKGYSLDLNLKELYEPEDIIHHKFFNPANPLLGIAPLEAAARTVDIDNAQQDWNKSAMQNRGVVDGVMSFERTFDSQDQVDKIAEKLNESGAGPSNARKIKVVGSNAKYTRMSLNPVEMDFTNSRDKNRDAIFIIFGIPPAYGGSQEASTYNNFNVSELIFWFQTCIPLLDDIKDTFNLSFRDELKENETLSYDLSRVPAIKKAMIEWTETATKLHEMGVPFEQLNKVFSFGFQEFENWEKSYVKESKPEQVEQRMNISSGKYNFKTPFNEIKYTLVETRDVFDEKKEIAKLAEGPIKDIIFNLLDKQREAVFNNLTESGAKAIIKKSIPDWVTEFNKIYMDIGIEFGSKLVVEKRTIESEIEIAMGDFLESEKIILTECSFIAETTTDKILAQIADGIEQGYSIGQIQQAITDTGIFSPARALAIARTETGTAANLGQFTAAGISGADKKTWSTATFEVRDSHQVMNGVTVDIDKPFTVGGESAMYPMDNNLSPGERVNCFLPGTKIYGQISKGMKSIYEGEAFEIKTLNGHVLRVTMNHPIFTDQGVVPARLVKQGDKVVTNKINIERTMLIPSDKNNCPSTVENIFSTLSLIASPEIIGTIPEYFNCDAASIKGDINIISTNRELLSDFKSSFPERRSKVVLKKSLSELLFKNSGGSFALGFSGVFTPSPGLPCSDHVFMDKSFIFFDFIPFEFFGLTSISEFNPILFKDSINRLSGNIEHLRKFFDAETAQILFDYFRLFGFNLTVSLIDVAPRFSTVYDPSSIKNVIKSSGCKRDGIHDVLNSFSGNVSVDNVLSVHKFNYSGTVYDVESPYGWVFANSILSSNCMCTLTYSIEN